MATTRSESDLKANMVLASFVCTFDDVSVTVQVCRGGDSLAKDGGLVLASLELIEKVSPNVPGCTSNDRIVFLGCLRLLFPLPLGCGCP